MRGARLDRLFHSIVVLGAALGAGCSSNVEVDSGQSASGAGGAGGGAGGSAGEGGAAGGAGGGGGQDGGVVIDDPSDCPSTAQYHCMYVNDGLLCYCDPNAPTGPEACEKTADFHCSEYEPDYVSCKCVPGSPATAEGCEDFRFWYCSYYDPPMGCMCVVPIA